MFLDFEFSQVDTKDFVVLQYLRNAVYHGEVVIKHQDGMVEKLSPEDPELAEKLKKAVSKTRHGFGAYFILDEIGGIKESYAGQWFEDKINGHFEIRYQDGSTYNGKLLFGRKNGYGKFTWTDGKNYQGFWKDDKMNGTGIYTDNQKSFEGTFINNYYLQPNNELVSPFMIDGIVEANPRAKFNLERTKHQNMYMKNYRFELHTNYEGLVQFAKSCFDKDMICLMGTFRNGGRQLKDIYSNIKSQGALCYIDLKKLQALKTTNGPEYVAYHKAIVESLTRAVIGNGNVLINFDETTPKYRDTQVDLPKLCSTDIFLNYIFNPTELKTAIKIRKSFELGEEKVERVSLGVLLYSSFKYDKSQPLRMSEVKIKDRFRHECDLKKCSVSILH